MSDIATLPPDGSWADPLSRAERCQVAALLTRACTRFWDAAAPKPGRRVRTGGTDPLLGASREMAVLYLDVTERAKVAGS